MRDGLPGGALQSLDQELKVPDVLLAEMTLANAGISEDQRLMIRTVLQGRVTTDTIATELLSQHPNIHERERRSGRSKGHGNKGSWRFPPRHKGGHRGFFSEDLQTGMDDWETGSQSLTGFSAVLDEERYDPEYDETLAYVADSQYDMSHDEDEDGFLVMNFALLCEDGLDLQSDEACALAAESLQLEHEAYLLRGHGKGKGHGGFQAQRQFDISGSVSFQERKARLAQLKARTECRRCGAKGHWSGDAACPKGQKKGGSKKHQGTSQTSTRPPQSAQGGSQATRMPSHEWCTFHIVVILGKMVFDTWLSKRSPMMICHAQQGCVCLRLHPCRAHHPCGALWTVLSLRHLLPTL